MENKFTVDASKLDALKFGPDGLIPAVAQDVKSGDVGDAGVHEPRVA